MKNFLKRLYYAFNPSDKLVLLDYAIDPQPTYTIHSPHKQLFKLIASNDNKYEELLKYCLHFREAFIEIKDSTVEKDNTLPAWNNNYVPGLDIVILYSLINFLKPKRYIEIGSGTTTKTV